MMTPETALLAALSAAVEQYERDSGLIAGLHVDLRGPEDEQSRMFTWNGQALRQWGDEEVRQYRGLLDAVGKREGGSVCPKCRGKLRRQTGQQGGADTLQCNACGYRETVL